ncbi:hypothetical protein [Thermocrinis sp.]
MEGKTIRIHQWLIIKLLFVSFSFGVDVCIKHLKNPFPEPYLTYTLRHTIERAFLQAEVRLSCTENAQEVEVVVLELKDDPIGFSPFQRVNVYQLSLSFNLKFKEEEKNYSVKVSYSLPSGAEGDRSRRFAINDALNIIYPKLLEDLIRRYKHADKF